jgi:hypothetical protein
VQKAGILTIAVLATSMLGGCTRESALGASYDECILRNVASKPIEQQVYSGNEARRICAEKFTQRGRRALRVSRVPFSSDGPNFVATAHGSRLAIIPAEAFKGPRRVDLDTLEMVQIERSSADLPTRVVVKLRVRSERTKTRMLGAHVRLPVSAEAEEVVGTLELAPGTRDPVTLWVVVPDQYATGFRRELSAEAVEFLRN